jgi:hypothetical protein
MMLIEMKKRLENFVQLQISLVGVLKNQYSEVSDWELLLDLPKRGTFSCNEEEWEFRQHGRGVCFQQRHGRGMVIDVHRGLNHPEDFDAWRLLQYFESLGLPESEDFWEKQLQELMVVGAVSEHRNIPKLYTLNEHTKRINEPNLLISTGERELAQV